MPTYIQNYGFTKTTINNNKKKSNNEIEWIGDYDGNIANIDLKMNNNGNKEFVSLKLTNNDLINLFGIKPVETPIDERLYADFLTETNSGPFLQSNPMILEGALIPKPKVNKHKSRKNRKLRHHKRKQTCRHF